jgi:cyclic-di-GMP-binding protein
MPQSQTLSPDLSRLPELTDRKDREAPSDALPAEDSLLSLLGEIEQNPPRPAAYLHTLERLRKPILLAQENLAKRFADAPVPLSDAENAALIRAQDLWAAVARAYRRLLGEAIGGKHPELTASLALLCQRALACTGELMVAQYLARREIEGAYWHALHEAYAVAESHSVTASAVADVRHDATPASAYAEVLLMELANPYGLSTQEFVRVRRWTGHWADKAQFVRDAPPQGGYAVDMAGTCGPVWTSAGTSARSSRFLDLTEVSSSVKKRLRRLEEGVDPGELGLGHDCTPSVAENLLRTLGRAWLEPPAAARAFPRVGVTSPTLLASGFASIHRALSENSLGAAATKASYSYGEADRLHTLQRAYEAGANWESRVPGLENWERFEESPKEFRLRRKEPGARLAFRQLVALRPRGARQFILCEVRSLSEDADHTLTIGARPLPGIAKTCTVKAMDPGIPPAQALMLPGGQGLPAAFLLPAGWFRKGREIEVGAGGQVSRVRLSALLDHGFDYERVQTGTP